MSLVFYYGVMVVAFAAVNLVVLICERSVLQSAASWSLWVGKLGLSINIIILGVAIALTVGGYI